MDEFYFPMDLLNFGRFLVKILQSLGICPSDAQFVTHFDVFG